MKLSKTCLSLFAALAGSLSGVQALAHDMVPGKAQTTPLLLTGLTVHTVTDGVKADSDVLIVDGKIAAVKRSLRRPCEDNLKAHDSPRFVHLLQQDWLFTSKMHQRCVIVHWTQFFWNDQGP